MDDGSNRFIRFEGGSFEMARTSPALANDPRNVWPIHTVTLKPFSLQFRETTVAEYRACIDAGGCEAPPDVHVNERCNLNSPRGERQPINCLTWYHARSYCAWLGARLPTEAEWEFAARSGGKDIDYPWGNEPPTCDRTVMQVGDTLGCGTGFSFDVCSKPAGNSAQGLCDLAGNLFEWLEDDWHTGYVGAPTDGSAWIDDPRAEARIERGGSYILDPVFLRAQIRGEDRATLTNYATGVRCAK